MLAKRKIVGKKVEVAEFLATQIRPEGPPVIVIVQDPDPYQSSGSGTESSQGN